jgi:hypothetical protein
MKKVVVIQNQVQMYLNSWPLTKCTDRKDVAAKHGKAAPLNTNPCPQQ